MLIKKADHTVNRTWIENLHIYKGKKLPTEKPKPRFEPATSYEVKQRCHPYSQQLRFKLKSKLKHTYIVEGHLAEQGIHQLVHVSGCRLQ